MVFQLRSILHLTVVTVVTYIVGLAFWVVYLTGSAIQTPTYPRPAATAAPPERSSTSQPTTKKDWIDKVYGNGIPTDEDAEACIANWNTLWKEAKSLATRPARSDSKFDDKDTCWQIWCKEENSWEHSRNDLLNRCMELIGADGTMVTPEIQLSLENLKPASLWSLNAFKAARNNDKKSMQSYLRGANKATKLALDILSGKTKADPATALIQVPKYIRAADTRMRRVDPPTYTWSRDGFLSNHFSIMH